MKLSYRRSRIERKRAEGKLMARESNRVQREKRMTRTLDADTLRMRALYDAKGQVLRHGITYTATTERPWSIRRAVHGRINQVELVVCGLARRIGSLRKANSAARIGIWTP